MKPADTDVRNPGNALWSTRFRRGLRWALLAVLVIAAIGHLSGWRPLPRIEWLVAGAVYLLVGWPGLRRIPALPILRRLTAGDAEAGMQLAAAGVDGSGPDRPGASRIDTASRPAPVDADGPIGRLVSIYRTPRQFCLCPSSMQGPLGLRVSHAPGVTLPLEAAADDIARTVIELAGHCRLDPPPSGPVEPPAFPFKGLVGIRSWTALDKASPVLVQVELAEPATTVTRAVRTGNHHAPRSCRELPAASNLPVDVLGAEIQRAFATQD